MSQFAPIIQTALAAFTVAHRESLASANDEALGAIVAYEQIHAQDELDTQNLTVAAVLAHIEETYLNLIDRGIITFDKTITALGRSDLLNLRISTGRAEAPAPPEPEPTAEELLYEEAKSDWNNGLSTDKIRKKQSTNRAYAAALERVIAETELSPVTQHVDFSHIDLSSNPQYRRTR